MSGTGRGAGRGVGSPGGHLDAPTVADLLEGLLPDGDARRAAAHLAACGRCAALRDHLRDVPRLLAAVPDPGPVPADVAARLDAALAAAAADPTRPAADRTSAATADVPPPSAGDVPPGGATVRPLTSASSPARRRTRWLPGAAAAAVVVGLAAVTLPALDGPNAGEDTAASAPAQGADAGAAESGPPDRAAPLILASGTDYTADAVEQAAPGLAAGGPTAVAAPPRPTGEQPAAARPEGALPDPTAGRSAESPRAAAGSAGPPGPPADPALARLADPAALAACAAALADGGPADPLAVDLARYEGVPAAVVVLPSAEDPQVLAVYVVGAGCRPGDEQLRYLARVER